MFVNEIKQKMKKILFYYFFKGLMLKFHCYKTGLG